MSADRFSYRSDSPVAPSRHAFEIVPNDTLPLPTVPKALFVGQAGTVKLRTINSATDVTLVVQAGQIVPVRASHVRATGTSATALVALA
ncbi:MAG TPA: hypothetical protein VNR60_02235 [Croceibacterium sp.]|nr:hypothetical protein [Croceibacterium sp.]